MKSCRNCKNSTHSWGYQHALLCKFNKEVIVPFSKCLEENKASDTRARTIASRCKAYEPEGDTLHSI